MIFMKACRADDHYVVPLKNVLNLLERTNWRLNLGILLNYAYNIIIDHFLSTMPLQQLAGR